MANPQCENGYTRIANEIIDHLCKYRLAGQQWQIIWVILRKTWGFKKKQDMIPLSQFSKLTGIDRRKVPALLDSLVEKNMIQKTVTNKGDRETILYGIQKDYEKWKVSPKKVTTPKVSPKKVQSVPNNGVKSVPNNGALKRKEKKLSKENNICLNSCAVALSHHLLDSILTWKPNFKKPTTAQMQKWYIEFDRMLRLDSGGRDPVKTKEIIDFATTDDFWQPNILSAKKLREQYDQLEAKMNKPSKQRFL